MHGLLTEDVVTFEGSHYRLKGAPFAPKGVQEPHPPIIVGGDGGPRLAALVSRWADEFNTVGGPPRASGERIARVRDALDADGRDQSTLTTSLMTWCYVGATEAEAIDADRAGESGRCGPESSRTSSRAAGRLRRRLADAGGRAAQASTGRPGCSGSC